MAALTVTNCCSSFDASPFNADTMFIGPPAAIYHTKSSKHEVLTFRDLARGNNMKSKPVGNQVSIACAVRAAWECESPFGCGRISRIDECVPVGGLRDLAKQAVVSARSRQGSNHAVSADGHRAGLCIETEEEWQRMCQ